MTTDPNIAILLIVVGMLGIYLEFCRPGWVIPGVAGGVIAMAGLASLVHSIRAGQSGQISWPLVIAILIPFVMLSLWLGKIAIRAKRNKAAVRMR